MPIITYAIQAFNLVKSAIEAGKALKEVYEIIERTNDALGTMEAESRGPSDAEWAALNTETDNLRVQRPDVTGE